MDDLAKLRAKIADRRKRFPQAATVVVGIDEAYALLSAHASALARVAVLEGALAKVAASGPSERPDGPDYQCGNANDVAWDASQLTAWNIAQIARAALRTEGEGQ